MTAPVPSLVVTVPGRTLEAARREVARARDAGADLVELRFDRWEAPERARAGEMFPTPLPLIATYRSRAEGGEGADDPSERRAVLRELARLPFAYLDTEPRRDTGFFVNAEAPSGPAAPRPILSTHLPAGTAAGTALAEVGAPVPDGTLRKVVLPMPTGTALSELVPVLTRSPLGPGRVLHPPGGSGSLLRALGKRLGLALVYAGLPESGGPSTTPPVEAAQLPADRLRRFFEAPDEPPLFAVLGHPVDHSLSPRLHSEWLRRTGKAGMYVALDIVSPDELSTALVRLAPLGFRGVNVTHPWKADALRAASRATPTAAACGAANCLTLSAEGIGAENTDVAAVRRRLEELRTDGGWAGDRLSVLGAGGAARATLLAASALGAEATVYARRRTSADEVAGRLGARVGDAKHPVAAPLVVQATPAGHPGAGTLELPLERFLERGGSVLDWVYGGADSSVARAAHRAGASYESGERLLVYQAASSFAVWWGEAPDAASVAAALEEVGCTA